MARKVERCRCVVEKFDLVGPQNISFAPVSPQNLEISLLGHQLTVSSTPRGEPFAAVPTILGSPGRKLCLGTHQVNFSYVVILSPIEEVLVSGHRSSDPKSKQSYSTFPLTCNRPVFHSLPDFQAEKVLERKARDPAPKAYVQYS